MAAGSSPPSKSECNRHGWIHGIKFNLHVAACLQGDLWTAGLPAPRFGARAENDRDRGRQQHHVFSKNCPGKAAKASGVPNSGCATPGVVTMNVNVMAKAITAIAPPIAAGRG